jgi:DNA polymerase III subunit gamma/tau
MSYQVIARKWRPQTFDELVGQDAIAQTLKNAVLQNRIAHAYLFAGARGVGKTSTARILAKALNCLQGPTVTPCNVCDACKEITAGNSIDVLEIDAASNRGIDEIRELRENVKYAAAKDRYKVFIIDEVHMLTTEAFNALLKTLEEPPPQVVFVLATTELHKVPSTILSRCQHFNFRTIRHQEILGQLSRIAESEQIQISEESLHAIARASEGSMRDAQSQLEQIVSFCGNAIRDELVKELLGVVPYQMLEEFTQAIIQSDSRGLIQLVERLVQSGLNLQHFIRELIAHTRNLMMLKISGEDPQLIPLAPAEMTRCHEFSNLFSEEDLTRFFSILVSTESDMRWSSQPRFQLEMGLMKILQAKKLVSIEELLANLGGNPLIPATNYSSGKKLTGTLKPTISGSLGVATAVKLQVHSDPELPGKPKLEELSQKIRQAVFEKSPMISALLDHAVAMKLSDREIEVLFLEKEKFSYDMLQARENLQLVQQVADSVTGSPRLIRLILSEEKTPKTLVVKDSESNSTDPRVDPIEQIKEDSAVKNFLATFQGEIVEIKELKR